MEKLRIGSFFSGTGAFEKALERLEIPHKTVFYCEIDKYASKAYSLIHQVSESFNLWDITRVDEKALPDFDLMTWGFPCQSISVAGKQEGVQVKCDCGEVFPISDLEDGHCPFCSGGGIQSYTRSGLYYDGLRILKHKKPKYSIIENVKNLVGKKFQAEFKQMLCDLDDAGYRSYWQVLNAKDYGIPQNRERVFIVSIRKDIDPGFMFPQPFDNGLRLKDLLEDEIDERYFYSQEKVEKILNSSFHQEQGRIHDPNGICSTLCARDYKDPMCVQVGTLNIKGNEQIKRIYATWGIAPTLNTCGGGNTQAKISVNGKTRKLTPLEYFRLMGFDDADYWLCKTAGISDSQLYKMAGNSIVVQVLEGILGNLLKSGAEVPGYFYGEQMSLFG